MKTCIKCGGGLYRDADTLCAHDYGDPPEPYAWPGTAGVPPHHERVWCAAGRLGDANIVVHPTRDGAIALWKDRWRWGHALAALFRWLHAPRAVLFESITCECGSARFVVDPVSIERAARDARCVACGTRTCVVFKPRMVGATTLELARELAGLGDDPAQALTRLRPDQSAERRQLITQEMLDTAPLYVTDDADRFDEETRAKLRATLDRLASTGWTISERASG